MVLLAVSEVQLVKSRDRLGRPLHSEAPAGEAELAGHAWHSASPHPLKVPDLQGEHSTAPADARNLPVGHDWHLEYRRSTMPLPPDLPATELSPPAPPPPPPVPSIPAV